MHHDVPFLSFDGIMNQMFVVPSAQASHQGSCLGQELNSFSNALRACAVLLIFVAHHLMVKLKRQKESFGYFW